MSTRVNRFRQFLAAAVASLALIASPALAQFAPQPADPSVQATYRATIVGLVTAATATDFFTIYGSASKIVHVRNIECSGIGSTAGTADILGIKRSAVNTGGTSAAPTRVPLSSNLSTAPAPTATVLAYTANPSGLGAAVGTVRAQKLGLPLAATGAMVQQLVWQFSDRDRATRSVQLRGIAEGFALNGNAATLAAGATLNCSIEWTES